MSSVRILAQGLRWPLLRRLLFSLALIAGCSAPGQRGHAGATPASGPSVDLGPPPPPPPEPPMVEPSAAPRKPAAPGAPLAVLTDPGEVPRLRASDGQPLPLEHTHVSARLDGFVAEVEVTQTYKNPASSPIEAVYIFPLPENAAVHAMKMVIGPRVIEAAVDERKAARAAYEQARQKGHTAALLEQERPNVFTQSVANIAPGKPIQIALRYIQTLTYDAGSYEFVFPMVVGPRYIPGAPLGGAPAGDGARPDTEAVPDASRISPPYLGKGERSGHDISMEVVVNRAGMVSEVEVPTHEVKTDTTPEGTLRLVLSTKDRVPNRDFVLRYRTDGPAPQATLYASGKEQGYFSLIVHPPALDVNELIGRRELVFVVDVSGSMEGSPLLLCKGALREALSRMRPVDTFNVITFAGHTGKLFPEPRPASDEAVRQALAFVDRLSAGGGTEMIDAVEEALGVGPDNGRHRYVFFLTDGYVGNEDQIVQTAGNYVTLMEARGRRARVFGFGVGSSPNRALMDGLTRKGKGLVVSAASSEDPLRAVNQFYRYIDRSVLRDVSLRFSGASEVFPAQIPDLFASRPVIVHGRWKGDLSAPISVRAAGASGPVEIPVRVVRESIDPPRPGLGLLWARSKIAWLETDVDRMPSFRDQITRLGIEHHLVTAYTSFIAIDRDTTVGDGQPRTIVQPVEVPEGVDPRASGASPGAVGYEVGFLSEDRVSMTVSPDLPPEEGDDGYLPRAAPGKSGGCACEVGRPQPAGAALALAALGLLAARRRPGRGGPGARKQGPAARSGNVSPRGRSGHL